MQEKQEHQILNQKSQTVQIVYRPEVVYKVTRRPHAYRNGFPRIDELYANNASLLSTY